MPGAHDPAGGSPAAAHGHRVQAANAGPPLRELFLEMGTLVASSANQPVDVGGRAGIWYVAEGALDVFVSESDSELPMRRRHLLRSAAGHLVFGLDDPSGQLAVSAKGVPGTLLYRLPASELLERCSEGHATPAEGAAEEIAPMPGAGSGDLADEVARQADIWVRAVAASVAGLVDYRPQPSHLVRPPAGEPTLEAKSGEVLSARAGSVVWLRAVTAPGARANSPLAYLGTEYPQPEAAGWIPLTSEGWVTITESVSVAALSSLRLAREGRLLAALGEFHDLAFGAERMNRLLTQADEVNEQRNRTTSRRQAHDRSMRLLAAVAHRDGAGAEIGTGRAGSVSEMESVLSVIGHFEGFEVPPVDRPTALGPPSTPEELLVASDVRTRQIKLAADDRWWRLDSGALMGFEAATKRPVALLPGAWRGYRAIDADGTRHRVDAGFARSLDAAAWQFYPTLPAERPATARDLARLGGRRIGKDTVRFSVVGLLAALLAQAPAVALGVLVAEVLPFSSRAALAGLVATVAMLSLLALLAGMLSGASLMRIEGRSAARVEAAMWSRLLRLPPQFFRSTMSGELLARMDTLRQVRDAVAGAVARASLALVFAAPTFAVLMLYDLRLGVLSICVAAVAAGLIVAMGVRQLNPQRQLREAFRRLGGQLLQIINGSSKIRSSGAQGPAFLLWAKEFREVQLAQIRAWRINEHTIALGAALPAIGGALLVGAAASGGGSGTTVSDFLIIFTASMTFFAALGQFGSAMATLVSVVPAYEQVKPILQAVPEPVDDHGAEAQLQGELRLDKVSFSYEPAGPLVLDNVSIHAQPGDFIAIVGGSGSGKSTLVRVLLGLDPPMSGSVYFDGRDLGHLNRSSVRRQIGTVAQDSVLAPGTLLDNIIGVTQNRSLEEAWEAARLAAIDRDIAAMPMQMLTPVSDRVTTFSGGQVQRIRIAAVLAAKPRILVFDEATSWLDAATQAEVMSNIRELAITRVVVAHRLSTIRSADQIYVLEAGRIVQQGTFDELNEVDGTFADLVSRQQA